MNQDEQLKMQIWFSIIENWQGRQWLWHEWEQAVSTIAPEFVDEIETWTMRAVKRQRIEISNAVTRHVHKKWFMKKEAFHCMRCGTDEPTDFYVGDCMNCRSNQCAYCERCFEMGRAKTCTRMVYIPFQCEASKVNEIPASAYRLTPDQQQASSAVLDHVEHGGEFLLWAVTGAGKTEMLFPIIEHTLREGKRMMIAAPRRDVILELYPRIQHVFGEANIAAWYGGCTEPWRSASVVVSTTHQLLRCREAFDVLVIDECDAFPFRDNQMLGDLARRSLKSNGLLVWLTATPEQRLEMDAIQKKIGIAQIRRRFHGFDLPVPKRLSINAEQEKSIVFTKEIMIALIRSIERGAGVFWFVPTVNDVQKTIESLRKNLPAWEDKIEGTYAADVQRAQRVLRFRAGEIRLLVCTAILERGITLPKADVFVWHADHRLYDEASLVQMAGRAGRSAADAQMANVFLIARTYTESQRKAIKQIQSKNKFKSKRESTNVP